MANRSYLYSFKKDKDGKHIKTFDISEQNYAIPIIYKILVSANTEIVSSKIFDKTIALVGEAKEGRKRLDAFFITLHQQQIFETEELAELQAMFNEHLDKYTLDYFLFEPAEVLDMTYENIDNEVKVIAAEINDYKKMITNFFLETNGDEWSELGIDYSSYCYFSFGEEAEVETIEQEFNRTKQVRLEQQITLNPTAELYFKLLSTFDKRTEAKEIDQLIDKVLTFDLTFEERSQCARNYNDLDERITLLKNVIADYPNEEKSKTLNYYISIAYEDKGDYQSALEYRIKDVVDNNEDVEELDDLIEKGKFNKGAVLENVYKRKEKQTLHIELPQFSPEEIIQKKETQEYIQALAEISKKSKEELQQIVLQQLKDGTLNITPKGK